MSSSKADAIGVKRVLAFQIYELMESKDLSSMRTKQDDLLWLELRSNSRDQFPNDFIWDTKASINRLLASFQDC
jgi:hypothetical protein